MTLLAGVQGFAALLAAAVVVGIAAERARIPAAVLLVALGAVAGSAWGVRPPFAFGPALLFVFLAPLIFEAAWNVDLAALRRTLVPIAVLAFPGVLVSAFAVAAGLAAVGALPFGAALVYGAIVAATDPVAVVAVFRRVDVPAAVRTIVEGESIANDGVAVVLYGIAVTLASGGGGTGDGTASAGGVANGAVSWLAASVHGVVALAGGGAVGVVCGLVVWLTLRLTRTAEYEVTATVALAYAAYLFAQALGLSGIFATAAAAVTLRAGLAHTPALDHPGDVDRFWNATAYLGNAVVFLATGLLIDLPRALHEPLLVVTALAVVALARVVLVIVALRERAARATVFLAGMRGALPLALALSLPAELPHRAEIIDAVFATVLVTLVVQGAALESVVRRFYDSAGADRSEARTATDSADG